VWLLGLPGSPRLGKQADADKGAEDREMIASYQQTEPNELQREDWRLSTTTVARGIDDGDQYQVERMIYRVGVGKDVSVGECRRFGKGDWKELGIEGVGSVGDIRLPRVASSMYRESLALRLTIEQRECASSNHPNERPYPRSPFLPFRLPSWLLDWIDYPP
jgi:hypothetical protein